MQEQAGLAKDRSTSPPSDGQGPRQQPIDADDPVVRLLLSLCSWPRDRATIDADELADEQGWSRALTLVKLHGLIPILYAAQREGCLSRDIPDPDALRRAYYVQAARAALALDELGDIAGALSRHGVPCIVLKGAASMLSIYRDPAMRVLSDLDLLVHLDDLDQAVAALEGAGYRKVVTTTSREDEWLSVMYFDGISMYRGRNLPIELHCSFLGGIGDADQAVSEAWERSVRLQLEGQALTALCPEHAFITAACHLYRNSHRSLPYMKDVADLLLLAQQVDEREGWNRLRDTCRRWSVEREVHGVCAFINAYLPATVPLGSGNPPAFTPADLAYALDRLEGRGRLTEGLAARLRLIGRLPSWQARCRFLWGLIAPSKEFLRWRYRIRDGRSLAPYYARHVLKAVKRTTMDAVLRARQRRRYR
ncbi:MAG: nucleotidyltransferase family protein [Chthonomonadales bacterium]|nr:nucleotidyltransferase family protein [Chthonomonadales bacterium]